MSLAGICFPQENVRRGRRGGDSGTVYRGIKLPRLHKPDNSIAKLATYAVEKSTSTNQAIPHHNPF